MIRRPPRSTLIFNTLSLHDALPISEVLQKEEKEYIASIKLGATTPCYDLEKEIDQTFPFEHITEDAVRDVLKGMIGEQEQIPPIFSAKLIDGVRAYEMARAGEDVKMRPAIITIYDLELISYDLPNIVVKVKCSKGTYIRSLARDIGVALNSGGHLTGLIRSQSGYFKIEDAIKIDDIQTIL